VRLAVSDLKRSMNFYSEVIGLAVLDAPSAETRVARLGPHGGGQVLLELHMGLNVWAAGSPPASERDARLLFWELVLPNKDEVERVKVNLVKAGYPALRTAGAVPAFADPWGITVALVAA
jgi:catechol 2,3-dioxygenase